MTREQIEYQRRKLVDHEERESATQECIAQINRLCDLAERALLLEDVLSAAREAVGLVRVDDDDNAIALDALNAAIDRAEGR